MKDLILIACLMMSAISFSQVTTEVYDLDDNLLSRVNENCTITWRVNESTSEIGYIIESRTGEVLGGNIFDIFKYASDEETMTYVIKFKSGDHIFIIFWLNLAVDEPPMMAFDYADGHTLIFGRGLHY